MERFDQPLAELTVIPVKLDEETATALTDYLHRELDAALRARKPLEEKWQVWVKQYNGRLEREGAGPLDSKLDMGSTRKHCAQNAARLVTPFFSQDKVFVAKPRVAGKPGAEFVQFYERILDHLEDRKYDMQFCATSAKYAQIFGLAVAKMGWTVERQKVLRWVTPTVPRELDTDPIMAPAYLAAEHNRLQNDEKTLAFDGTKYLTEQIVEVRVGCFPEVIPNQDFLYPAYATDLRTSPWLGHCSWKTSDEIKDGVREGIYDEATVAQLGAADKVRPRMFEPESKDGDDPFAGTEAGKQYPIYEVYLDFDIDKDGYREEIIVRWSQEKKLILSCVYNWVSEYRRPFTSFSYEVREDTVEGNSLCYILEPYHRAKSASINQRLDAATKANEKLLMVRDDDLMRQFTNGRLRGGVVRTNANPNEEVAMFELSQPFSQLADLEGQFEGEMMALAGQAELMFGNEPTSRPTAYGTAARLEQASMPTDLMVDRFREYYAEVALQRLARYKQFYPEGLQAFIVSEGPEAAEKLTELMTWPEGAIAEHVYIETKVSSTTLNVERRKQEKMALIDKLPQVAQQAMTLIQAASTPGPGAPLAQEFLKMYMGIVRDFCLDFEVEGADKIGVSLEQATDAGIILGQALAEAQSTIQSLQMQLGQAPPAPGVPGGQGVPPGPPTGASPPVGMGGAGGMAGGKA